MGYVFLPHHAIFSRIIKGINVAILYGVLYILMSADIVRHFLWKSIWNDVSPLGKRLFKVGRSRGWCTKCSSLAEGPYHYHIALDTIIICWTHLVFGACFSWLQRPAELDVKESVYQGFYLFFLQDILFGRWLVNEWVRCIYSSLENLVI